MRITFRFFYSFLLAILGMGFLFLTLRGISAQETPSGAQLLGIRPGITMFETLKENPIFQKPYSTDKTEGYDVYVYQLKDEALSETPFVQLLVKDGIVDVLFVHLKGPHKISDMRTSFHDQILDTKPIVIQDAEKNFREIYPETGVSFIFKKDEKDSDKPSGMVTQIALEKVKPDFFLVRADENRRKLFAEGTLAQMCADAEKVLEIDPKNGSAYWLLGIADFLVEDYAEAQKLVSEAVPLNDRVPEYHFLMMNILERTGNIEYGLRYWDAVKEVCTTNDLHSAEMSIIHSLFTAKKEEPEFDKAIRELQETIANLKPLVTEEKNSTENLKARELSADAYAALGNVIALKDWKDPKEKDKAYLWFGAARDILLDTKEKDPAVIVPLLDLYRTVSETALVIPENAEMDSFLADASETADSALDRHSGTLEEEMIRMKAGETFFNAFLASDTRGDSEAAEKYAVKAAEYFEPCIESAPEKVAAVIGPVDYELGIFLNEKGNHQEIAEKLLERAAKTIGESVKLDGSADDGDQGIRLVNIGKAFWCADKKDRGLELTKRGVEAIEKAIEAGNLPKEEFSIPCQNLVSIYNALGDSVNADIYTEKMHSLLENESESN